MDSFSLPKIHNQLIRLSTEKVKEIIGKYQKDLLKESVVDVNRLLNIVDSKFNIVENWQKKDGELDFLTIKFIASSRIPQLSRSVFEEIENLNKMDITILTELSSILEEQDILNLLRNFSTKLSSTVIQSFILNLSPSNQKRLLTEYKNKILEGDQRLLLIFISLLPKENKLIFIKLIKEHINNLNTMDFLFFIFMLSDNYIEYILKEYKEKISNLDEEGIINFIRVTTDKGVLLCLKEFNDLFSKPSINANSLYLSLVTRQTDLSNEIYSFWINNKNKLMELSNTNFTLLISRLDEFKRMSSLIDFKDKYNEIPVDELLALFEDDTDKIKEQFFIVYKPIIEKYDLNKVIAYINKNISDLNIRMNVFKKYKENICALEDKDFIEFLSSLNSKEDYYDLDYNFDETNTENEIKDFVLNNFSERIKTISEENISTLFKFSSNKLKESYISLCKDKIINIIRTKEHLSNLLHHCSSTEKTKLITMYEDEFKKLNAEDWYNLESVIREIINDIKDLLLKCNITSLDFINQEVMTKDYNYIRIYKYLEANYQNKLYQEYSKKLSTPELLIIRLETLITELENCNPAYLLIEPICTELFIIFRILFENNLINDKDERYIRCKNIYISKLISTYEVENQDNIEVVKHSLFYKLVKGSVKAPNLYLIESLKELIYLNQNLGKKDNSVIPILLEAKTVTEFLTEEQSIKINQKLLNQIIISLLNQQSEDPKTLATIAVQSTVIALATKLYLSLGFQNAKKVIDLDIEFTSLEYIFNNIDTKKIKLSDTGEPIIDKKLYDFLFGNNMNEQHNNILRLLSGNYEEFEKRFSEVYNNWNIIYNNLNGNVTLSRIIKWFEDNKVILNPDEYRLANYISEFSSDENVLLDARRLYKDMRNRKFSTIPQVTGRYDEEYTYEVLDLDDPLGLVVGYITRCCFLINGISKTSLYHSAQSKDGRIFVVRKNGELIAQSWMWRNGNLVCFDNVETRSNYDYQTLLEVYKKASEDIIDLSKETEEEKERIKLVTFGGGFSKISKPSERIPYNEIQKPRVNNYIYTDAEYEQFVLAKSQLSNLYYGDVSVEYKDIRKQPQYINDLSLLDEDTLNLISNQIKSIAFTKSEEIKNIDFSLISKIAFSSDWYIIVYKSGIIEYSFLDKDERAIEELKETLGYLKQFIDDIKILESLSIATEQVKLLTKRGDK